MLARIQQIDGYEVLEILSINRDTGTVVELAKCLATGTEVVIKSFKPDTAPKAKEHVKEALAQARVDHDNNCQLLELKMQRIDRTNWTVYLVMEKMSRNVLEDMDQRQRDVRPYSEEELLRCLSQVGQGLAQAKINVNRMQNLAHLDLKPENIFLDAKDNFKVGDFGSSWEKMEHENTIYGAGTPQYLSPELCIMLTCNVKEAKHKAFQSDVYSLGITLLELATLALIPNTGTQVLAQDIHRLKYSEKLKSFLWRMLQENPQRRPTIEQVVEFANFMLEEHNSASEEEQKGVPSQNFKQIFGKPGFRSSKLRSAPPMKLRPEPVPDVQQLIAVLQNEVKCFDIYTREWRQLFELSKGIQVDFSTSSTFIAPNRIIACGGGYSVFGACNCYEGDSAYLLEEDGIVQELPQMSTGRNGPGVTWDWTRDVLYVFGGCSANFTGIRYPGLRSCEMFKAKWTPLQEMHHARCYFNPCWHYLVYLCGGFYTNSVETYDPQSNTFDNQDFNLPESLGTTAVVECGVLIVISNVYISKLKHGKLTSQQHQHYYPWSNCTPVVMGDVLYLVRLDDGCCRGVNLATGDKVQEISLR